MEKPSLMPGTSKTALYYIKTRDVKNYFFSFNAACIRLSSCCCASNSSWRWRSWVATRSSVVSGMEKVGSLPKRGSSSICLRNEALMINCLPCEPLSVTARVCVFYDVPNRTVIKGKLHSYFSPENDACIVGLWKLLKKN